MREKAKRYLTYAFEGAIAFSIVGAIGYAFYYDWDSRDREYKEFMALDAVSVDAPAELSGLTLGDVFCASVKEHGQYDIEREKSVKGAVRVPLADGTFARLNCLDYEP